MNSGKDDIVFEEWHTVFRLYFDLENISQYV